MPPHRELGDGEGHAGHTGRRSAPIKQREELILSPEKKNRRITRFNDPSDISLQVEKAREQIEVLRKQQEDLQKEKSELEGLRTRYAELIEGKKDLVEALGNGIVILDAEEQEAERMHELAAETRRKFKELLADISAIQEDIPDEDNVGEQIGRGLILIDRGRKALNKARGRIEALSGRKETQSLPDLDERAEEKKDETSFAGAVRLGFGFAVPGLVLAIIILLLARVLLR